MSPTLPNEVIARILSLAAAQARADARTGSPLPFLRQLALLSRAWRDFGQAELLRKVLFQPAVDSPGPEQTRLLRLVETLSARPALRPSVKRVVVGTDGLYDGLWMRLVRLCPELKACAFRGSSVHLSYLTGCEEVAVFDGECSLSQPIKLTKLLRLRLWDAPPPSDLASHRFPNLEALAVWPELAPSCAPLLACPSLRALILPATAAGSPAAPLLDTAHILWDLSVLASVRAPLAAWPAARWPNHLRCRTTQCVELAGRVAAGAEGTAGLRTVYVCAQAVRSAAHVQTFEVLAVVGRAKGVAVRWEPEVAKDGFGFDYFLQQHGKPRGN